MLAIPPMMAEYEQHSRQPACQQVGCRTWSYQHRCDSPTPTVCIETTTVKAIRTRRRLLNKFAGMRKVAARIGSKEMTMNGLYRMMMDAMTINESGFPSSKGH